MSTSLELRIAWRNVWRNPRRTGLTLAATVFAVVLVMFAVAMGAGTHSKMIEDSVRVNAGHLQIAGPGFLEKRTLEQYVSYTPELEALLARFQDHLREWGSPSAVLAAIKDSSSESGWRLMPSLSFGSEPLGVELSLPRLIESAPGCLERPTIVRPEEEVPGVKPRDNCVVPWSHAGDSGILVLRGVPRPSPANLGRLNDSKALHY